VVRARFGAIEYLLGAQLIVAYNKHRLVVYQLLTDKIDQILHTFELALKAAADMLDAPTPCVSSLGIVLLNDNPEQKGLDSPVAHDPIS
jgi:hypothetical protein